MLASRPKKDACLGMSHEACVLGNLCVGISIGLYYKNKIMQSLVFHLLRTRESELVSI